MNYSIAKQGNIILIENGFSKISFFDDPFIVNCNCDQPAVLCSDVPSISDKIIVAGFIANCTASLIVRYEVLDFNNFEGYSTKDELCAYLESLKGNSNASNRISSDTAPTDPQFLTGEYTWYNTTSNQEFWYDTDQSKWLSIQVYSIVFNDNGNTGNNVFLRVGVTLSSLNEGYPLTRNINTRSFSYTNIREIASQQYTVFRGNLPVIQEPVPEVGKVGSINFTPIAILAGETIAAQKNGPQNQDTVFELFYNLEA